MNGPTAPGRRKDNNNIMQRIAKVPVPDQQILSSSLHPEQVLFMSENLSQQL